MLWIQFGVLFNAHPVYIHSHLGILDKMHNQQSSIDALHGQMTSQLNIDPALLSGVSCVTSAMLFVIVYLLTCSLLRARKLLALTMIVMILQ